MPQDRLGRGDLHSINGIVVLPRRHKWLQNLCDLDGAPRQAFLNPNHEAPDLYIVLKIFLADYLKYMAMAISVTFDGWSNASLRGFYVCTGHWTGSREICLDTTLVRLHEVVLDFLTVPSGVGIGTRCGEYLKTMLSIFNCSDKLVAIVSDGGGDVMVAANTGRTPWTSRRAATPTGSSATTSSASPTRCSWRSSLSPRSWSRPPRSCRPSWPTCATERPGVLGF